ncbi:TPA: GPO family capsid scaffolding protein [Klebsiella michiganensis]|uniref:GPO family capsid scaffolding protein n=1 Tax=Klebsiella michiganensis TaxID=1134687 RepID=UPI000668DF51|nr:GPO family capsid scaffolding protein [Klebsiella michiganensis]HAU5055626.1 GPO family capsid scaffolding protein [Klebsiella michiganensis]HDV9049311.1 GPO family capsid scaffolding protein [Klebsiella michiganensis]HDV9064112.1 GPO family capsid scaffolding protein [Klebsiella michiganensis]HDV9070913.1 GPO family capsid scaffolding protein [Klebsiella michiganensis]HDX8691743.1 GPO family capsid scaffolding protein [Klebsiella michiganensis]
MAGTAKPRKKFRVAVSGNTVDGREIQPQHLRDAAANYSPEVYGARVNIEHYLSMFPGSDFGAMGDVVALSTEDITDGPLAGRTALYAEIEPSDRMVQMTNKGQKVYSSIELHPQFALNGKAYVVGLAMTDTPASLGTDRLKFAAQQRASVMAFNNQQGEAPMFTEALEAEVIELAAQRSDEGKQWFNRVMGILGKGQKTDDQRFGQVHQAVEAVAQSQVDLGEQFSTAEQERQQDKATIQKLTTDLAALRQQLEGTDGNFSQRPAAGGGDNAQLADY